jgi:lysophospholipase L1-like esterase
LAVPAAVAAAVTAEVSSPADLSLTVQAGEVGLPGGGKVNFEKTVLRFDAPDYRPRTVTAKAPGNHADWWDPWQPWPKQGKPLTLKPQYDEEGTLILGGLFRQIHHEDVVVTSADGARTFKRDEDYVFLDDWGQIGNLNGRLGKPGEAELKVTCKIALQRLNLIQVLADGKVTVKKGKSVLVCPTLPEPDPGAAPLAGVYIAPWKAADNPNLEDGGAGQAGAGHVITRHEVFPINPAPPVQPVNKRAVTATLRKLRAGEQTRIAFMGASITLGAEAGAWWDDLWTDKNLGYPSRVVVALRRQFPEATVTPIDAFKGGTTTQYGLEMIETKVIPAKADLLLIAFGGNDAAGAIGRPPRNPAPRFKEDMRKMARRAKEAGMEVILVITMQQHPWQATAKRWPAYRQALLELAEEEEVACADVYTEWMNQATRGIPPFTQLHNWINHPGKAGHELYADVILRFFD